MTASAAVRCARRVRPTLRRSSGHVHPTNCLSPRAAHVLLIAKSAPRPKYPMKASRDRRIPTGPGHHARSSGPSCSRSCGRRPNIGPGRRGRKVRVGDLLKRHQFATEFLDCSDQPEQLRLVANRPGQDGGADIPVQSHRCEQHTELVAQFPADLDPVVPRSSHHVSHRNTVAPSMRPRAGLGGFT